MKCDQDLCLNFWYNLRMLLWQDELNPRVRCAFGNVEFLQHFGGQFLEEARCMKPCFLYLVTFSSPFPCVSIFITKTYSIIYLSKCIIFLFFMLARLLLSVYFAIESLQPH